MNVRGAPVAALVMALAVAVTLGGRPDTAAGTASRAGGYRIVLVSDMDRVARGYTIRPDGTQLTPLLAPRRQLVPFGVSRDGRTIAYQNDHNAVYVSGGNGTRLHPVVAKEAFHPALSRDGRNVAYSLGTRGIAVVRTSGRERRVFPGNGVYEIEWSPTGTALVYTSNPRDFPSLEIQTLSGRRRLLARRAWAPKWSPDGRWIAYSTMKGEWLVRTDGGGRHRLGLDGTVAWAPDGRSLAVGDRRGIALVGTDGRISRRIRLRSFQGVSRLSWAPGGRSLVVNLAVGSGPSQVWIAGADGHGLRRVTRYGNNDVLGWTRLAPVRRPVPPPGPSVRVIGPTAVATDRPIRALSADGGRVAFPAEATSADCAHIALWTPATKALGRFFTPATCGWPSESAVYDLELAGSRTAWAVEGSCGNFCSNELYTTTLGARSSAQLALGSTSNGDPPKDYQLRGDGDVLVFNDRSRLVRIGSGHERCQEGVRLAAICSTLRRGAHSGLVDSVSGGLIAVREDEAAAVLDEHGGLVRLFPLGAGQITAARLDGGWLVVARTGAIEVYDVPTGAGLLQRPLPARFRLVDVDRGIAVLLRNNVVMLLRLDDGRSVTLTPGRSPVLAELEASGLYYSYATTNGGGQVAFMARAELQQKLGS
jgi:Tol biopolymer transport system component